ncbi:ABC transporter ATP-binding protein [Kineococcus glutinatus]|uniref:ATP-binding cassette domain-containing protein n=1 Tax=Kineococcus glutinatus TaxID=1070872 RepID=A0ABP9HG91_9ACTN
MIEMHQLSKRYGDVLAVDSFDVTIRPGVVTGFLGPNGAGKSTTMRMVLGLDTPTSGSVLVNGRPYRDSPAPITEIGALLEAKSLDKGRSARNHLLALGATVGVGASRVDHLLELVGLGDVAHKSAGSFSLGMGQRLGVATALLGDPAVVMLDEPVNGLDPDGILWIRTFLPALAAEGRTVLLSSHLMSEMELTAQHLVVVGRGRLLADVSMAGFIAGATTDRVRISSPDAGRLRELLSGPGVTFTSETRGELVVQGIPVARIGECAAQNRLVLHALVPLVPSLEEAYRALTEDSVQYHGGTGWTVGIGVPAPARPALVP